ncbi:unnamed protein product [Arabis nemorensis]|uniref:Uncharacterized protein n=1 Tax=Arabis nemorensis TaxID=586526 RepID=A0A565BVS2_9BRAS|nr:unnamed protein product [Arabis nemorensis]
MSRHAWVPKRWLTYKTRRNNNKDMSEYGPIRVLDVNSNLKFVRSLGNGIVTNDSD